MRENVILALKEDINVLGTIVVIACLIQGSRDNLDARVYQCRDFERCDIDTNEQPIIELMMRIKMDMGLM